MLESVLGKCGGSCDPRASLLPSPETTLLVHPDSTGSYFPVLLNRRLFVSLVFVPSTHTFSDHYSFPQGIILIQASPSTVLTSLSDCPPSLATPASL